ncbi:MAG TPA: NfeD family protein [Planctomycetota bacterium]|nr:NfeD family protein [Planctomycetota bacterium]
MKSALLLLVLCAALPAPLLAPPRAASTAPARVVLVPIVGEIDFKNLILVRRAAREIKAAPPSLVIFEIDTPGGRVDHTLQMGEEIVGLGPIPTVAYVRPMGEDGMGGAAWSAGAYLAISCKKLYMAPGTVIGAAAPVSQTTEGARPVEEKYVSAIREKFRARAEQNGYPANLVVAMVDRDLEVFEVVVDGLKRYLTVREMDTLKAEGKAFDWPRTPFDSKDKLLTLTDRQVVETGMGRIAENRGRIYEDLGIAGPVETTLVPTWSETLAAFLTSGIASTILLVVGILGVWIELKTPGFGVPGIVGLVAFALLLFGHHLAGLAQAPEILLFVLGVVLVVVELVWFPGTGFFAIAGVGCALAGLVLSLQDFALPDVKGSPWQMDVLLSSVGRVMVSFLAAGLGFVALIRALPKLPMFGRLALQADLPGVAPAPVTDPDLPGRRGHAVTPLHPGGKIEVDGRVHDVVAEGEFVAQGEPVEVLRVEGFRIVVGKVKR